MAELDLLNEKIDNLEKRLKEMAESAEKEKRQDRCKHRNISVRILYNGYINPVHTECVDCGKMLYLMDGLHGFSREFSAKRIYRMFIK